MSEQTGAIFHLVAYQFDGRDRAGQVIDLVRKERRAAGYKVAAWAVADAVTLTPLWKPPSRTTPPGR